MVAEALRAQIQSMEEDIKSKEERIKSMEAVIKSKEERVQALENDLLKERERTSDPGTHAHAQQDQVAQEAETVGRGGRVAAAARAAESPGISAPPATGTGVAGLVGARNDGEGEGKAGARVAGSERVRARRAGRRRRRRGRLHQMPQRLRVVGFFELSGGGEGAFGLGFGRGSTGRTHGSQSSTRESESECVHLKASVKRVQAGRQQKRKMQAIRLVGLSLRRLPLRG